MGRSIDDFSREQHAKRKMLGQVTPPSSNIPVEIYSPNEGIEAVGITLTITNETTNQDHIGSGYYDDNGVTYDATTRIGRKTVTKGSEDAKVSLFIAMNNSAGSFAVESDSGGDLTFTLWGTERPKK